MCMIELVVFSQFYETAAFVWALKNKKKKKKTMAVSEREPSC